MEMSGDIFENLQSGGPLLLVPKSKEYPSSVKELLNSSILAYTVTV